MKHCGVRTGVRWRGGLIQQEVEGGGKARAGRPVYHNGLDLQSKVDSVRHFAVLGNEWGARGSKGGCRDWESGQCPLVGEMRKAPCTPRVGDLRLLLIHNALGSPCLP